MNILLRGKIAELGRSSFGRNVFWFTGLSAFERLFAVAQTVLISRALGITEYGIYGLLFGTIGFVASVVGLQMGLTATVFIAKYRDMEKTKAAAVISIVSKFACAVAVIFIVATLPFSKILSMWLLDSGKYQMPIILGILFVGATIVSGVQDGIAQGFELFGVLARLKILTSALSLAVIYPGAVRFGLMGVLVIVLAGLFLKLLILWFSIKKTRQLQQIPQFGRGVSFMGLVTGFAFPSMAVSLVVGFVTWLGMYILSRQPGGFEGVAIVNTGQQWRGPVLLLAASLGGVAVPVFSRLSTSGDPLATRRLRRNLALVNLMVAAGVAVVVIAGSGWIMKLYGDGFAGGRLAFCLIVLSTIPAVVANVYMQELIGAARMWRQLWLQIPYLLVMCVAFMVLIPSYGALGYAISLLSGSFLFLALVIAMDRVEYNGFTKSN